MRQFSIYAYPRDYPGHFVVREWLIMRDGPRLIPGAFHLYLTLEDAQADLDEMGLFRIIRAPEDDEKIVETWI